MNQRHHGRRRRKWAIEPPKMPLLTHPHRRIIVNEPPIMLVHDLLGDGRWVCRRSHVFDPAAMHHHTVEANAWPRTGRKRLLMVNSRRPYL